MERIPETSDLMEEQPALFAEPDQKRPQRLARSVHEAIIKLRKAGCEVRRRGRHHMVDGSDCSSSDVLRLARLLARDDARGRAFQEVLEVYKGSDGDATKALYAKLEAIGPAGYVAANLFRATKSSERAKQYRGRRYTGAAYDRKQWAMDNLARALNEHGSLLKLSWGWGEDPKQDFHRFVLYVDLPTGQVSFHTGARGEGPKYPGKWDEVRHQGPTRICAWCARLLIGAK